jgi:hypothetical protein
MHMETLQLITYLLIFPILGCILYVSFRLSPHLSHEAHSVPRMILAMAIPSLLATALFDLIIFAFASFNFSRLSFVGPLVYTDSVHRQPALLLHSLVAILGLWFGARWFSNHQSNLPSPEPRKMEY